MININEQTIKIETPKPIKLTKLNFSNFVKQHLQQMTKHLKEHYPVIINQVSQKPDPYYQRFIGIIGLTDDREMEISDHVDSYTFFSNHLGSYIFEEDDVFNTYVERENNSYENWAKIILQKYVDNLRVLDNEQSKFTIKDQRLIKFNQDKEARLFSSKQYIDWLVPNLEYLLRTRQLSYSQLSLISYDINYYAYKLLTVCDFKKLFTIDSKSTDKIQNYFRASFQFLFGVNPDTNFPLVISLLTRILNLLKQNNGNDEAIKAYQNLIAQYQKALATI